MHTKTPVFLPALLLGLSTVLLAGCGGPNLLERINNPWGYGLCSLIILVLDIIALLEVAGSDRSFGDKVLWGLLIFFFPVGGLILYYLFGRK
ncbi:PLD nuclease N-terminal domain-containing protein [Rhodocaloribacter litoris]|uniref:PLD nuclease N-terminal domain-containing protein n=1 Tax=Rhodocaloribacter litoris TaxID=2558931 RepID=UPI0014220870|nr:PLD nuclease N-terminal domain-containing protein [Rhodocaloribacter litoris]QXD16546.1 PLD nuclease N-terminal domain-containing protein [Rhodocaloribacter litoris]GIV59518.1 MAG: hypothetical protein KatS3mg043_0607 [Rhodothermaceae bacterium]